jgi:hypothetical protein
MNESLERRAVGNGHADFDPSVLAALTERCWKQDRPYFTQNERARGAWLQASWWRPPGQSALEMHWSRRVPCMASADLLPSSQAVSQVPVTSRLRRSGTESRNARTKIFKMANAQQSLHKLPVSSPFECIALLLQGGGALGAYRAGAYQLVHSVATARETRRTSCGGTKLDER